MPLCLPLHALYPFVRSLPECGSQAAVRDAEQASSSPLQVEKVGPKSEQSQLMGPPVQVLILIFLFFQCLMLSPAQS